MDVANLPALPAVVAASAVVIAEAVTALLALFAVPIASIPGFRADDATRNGLMRGLVAVLNIMGMVGLAWSQNVVIPREALPALLLIAVGQGALAHFTYVGAQKVASVSPAQSTADTTQTPASATTDAPAMASPLVEAVGSAL